MQTENMAAYSIGLFGDEQRHFWMGDLSGLLEEFPQLEYPHKQDFYTLLFVDRADGEVDIDNERIRLDAPKIIIIRPRCVSAVNINREAKGKMICFTADFFSLRYNNNNLYDFEFLRSEARPSIRLNGGGRDRFLLLLDLLSNEMMLERTESKNVMRSYLNIILHDIQRLYSPLGLMGSKNLKKEKLHKFEGLIDKHFRNEKLPSFYADLLSISTNYLNKICREENGQTAGAIIRRRITIEGQRLLHYTNCSVNEIAGQLGFENVSYFVTFFRKQINLTPEQFRKKVI